jgi:hypothetical protein
LLKVSVRVFHPLYCPYDLLLVGQHASIFPEMGVASTTARCGSRFSFEPSED